MQALVEKLTALVKTVNAEMVSRTRIMCSDEYRALENQIAALEEKQEIMLSDLPDSSLALAEAKREMMAAMEKEGREVVDNVTAKFREKKEVNRSRVLQAIDGDLDMYFTLSNITQVALKDFAKTCSEKKDDLLGCIEVVARDMVDVEVLV